MIYELFIQFLLGILFGILIEWDAQCIFFIIIIFILLIVINYFVNPTEIIFSGLIWYEIILRIIASMFGIYFGTKLYESFFN